MLKRFYWNLSFLGAFVILGWTPALLDCQALASEAPAWWKGEALEILESKCMKCHGPVKQKGGLDLSSWETMIQGGDSGAVFIPGRPEESLLIQVLHPDHDPHMPPEKQLEESEIERIKAWIAHSGDWHAEESSTSPSPKSPSAPSSSWLPDPSLQPHQALDGFVNHQLQRDGLLAAPQCDDRTFLRRIFLDLTGQLPAASDYQDFLWTSASDKREKIIDHLLQSREFPVYMREIFDVVLMERRGSRASDERQNNGWHAYLEKVFRENFPWDHFVRDLILARPSSAEDRGAQWFLYERKDNYQAMAESVAPLVYGSQFKCAQCHDHPLAKEIGQKHYWSLVSVFNRSKNVQTDSGIGIAESAIGGFINFVNLKKESQPAELAFLNGAFIPEERPADANAKEVDSPDLYLIPPPADSQTAPKPAVPKFSRREAFANAATTDNPLLARSMVNRMWALFMGRGLVHPVDEINSKYPASHPELLDWLSDDFAQNGYDVHRLIRMITLSQTYQRSGFVGKTPRNPNPSAFSHGLEKPLSAETLFRCFVQASGHNLQEAPSSDLNLSEMKNQFIEHFPDLFPVEQNASLQQAMFLSNSPLLDALLSPRTGNLMETLMNLENPEKQVRQAFLQVLGRFPDSDELETATTYLKARTDRTSSALKQLVWSLLTSAEFLNNY